MFICAVPGKLMLFALAVRCCGVGVLVGTSEAKYAEYFRGEKRRVFPRRNAPCVRKLASARGSLHE